MRWDPGPNAGFCPAGVEPWLPAGDCPARATVAEQRGDPDSDLALYRRLLRLRSGSPALSRGTLEVQAAGEALVYARTAGAERLVVAVNAGVRPAAAALPEGVVAVATTLAREGTRIGGDVLLQGNEALAVRVV
jgi:alpha-glucosidase